MTRSASDRAEIPARDCGDIDVVAGRGPGQRGWYQWATRHIVGSSVLDAGCGLGYGLDILAQSGADVQGQDLDPRLATSSRVTIAPLSAFRSKSFDVVVSIDVLEHIDDDGGFVAELARIGRRRLIVSTPNWTASRCQWPYHVREYTPAELRALCESLGRVQLWKGTPDGTTAFPITRSGANHWLNRARVHPLTAQPTKILNALLPTRARIHSHLAAIIDVEHRSV